MGPAEKNDELSGWRKEGGHASRDKRNRGKERREGGEGGGGWKVEEKKQEALLCILWKVLQVVLDWGAAFVTPHTSHRRPASESHV